jgi:hypothetical protein
LSVQARWHQDLPAADADPFAAQPEIDNPRVRGELREALEREAALFRRGVTCPLKEDGQDCRSCSCYSGDEPDKPMSRLCRTGREVLQLAAEADELGPCGDLIELASMTEDYRELIESV